MRGRKNRQTWTGIQTHTDGAAQPYSVCAAENTAIDRALEYARTIHGKMLSDELCDHNVSSIADQPRRIRPSRVMLACVLILHAIVSFMCTCDGFHCDCCVVDASRAWAVGLSPPSSAANEPYPAWRWVTAKDHLEMCYLCSIVVERSVKFVSDCCVSPTYCQCR